MKLRKLGHSDINVSEMGFGHCDFGTKVDKETAFKILDAFVEAGGNFIDTSNNYALWNPGGKGGECETIVGEWMQSRGNRKQIVIATKFGANIEDLSTVTNADGSIFSDWYFHGEGLSKRAMFKAIEGSLKRLKTDVIDLYYSHIQDPTTDPSETMEAFNELHQQGKIRAIGCSNHRAWRIEQAQQISRANGWIQYCCTQDLHTYLLKPYRYGDFANNDKLDYLHHHPDMTLIAYTPTLWGKYAQKDRYHNPDHWAGFYGIDTPARLKTLCQIASKHNASEIQIVYAWIMQNTPSAIPLVTTKSVDHLKENIAATEIRLSDEDLRALNNPCNS